MEVLFENNHVRNREIAKEVYKYFYFKRKIMLFLYSLLTLVFMLNIVLVIIKSSYSLTVMIIYPLAVLYIVSRYLHAVNVMLKRDRELYGKDVSVETTVTKEYIQITSSTGAVSKLEYNSIVYAAQTKNLILLITKAKLICIFRNDSFTKGDKDSFITFLKNKGIKVK